MRIQMFVAIAFLVLGLSCSNSNEAQSDASQSSACQYGTVFKLMIGSATSGSVEVPGVGPFANFGACQPVANWYNNRMGTNTYFCEQACRPASSSEVPEWQRRCQNLFGSSHGALCVNQSKGFTGNVNYLLNCSNGSIGLCASGCVGSGANPARCL